MYGRLPIWVRQRHVSRAQPHDPKPFSSCSVGGVLTLASFQRDFRYGNEYQTRVNALSVGLQQLGALLGCFLAWPIADHYGRKKPLMLFSAVFCIGGIAQAVNSHSLAAFYAARIVSGLGLGASTVVVPMFSSEMVPTELRGQIGSFFQLFFTLVRASVVLLIDAEADADREYSHPTGLTTESPSWRMSPLVNGRSPSACNCCRRFYLGPAHSHSRRVRGG